MSEIGQTNTINETKPGSKLFFVLSMIACVLSYIVSAGWIFLSLMPLIFCDSGPVSSCYTTSAVWFLSGLAGIILTIFFNIFLVKNKSVASLSIFLRSLAILLGLILVLPIVNMLLTI